MGNQNPGFVTFDDDLQTGISLFQGFFMQEQNGAGAEVSLRDGAVLDDPTEAPFASIESNTAGLVTNGTHSYVKTDVTTSGESEPSPVSNVVDVFGVDAPGAAVAANADLPGAVEAGTHSYKFTHVTATGETQAGTVSNTVTVSLSPPVACVAANANLPGAVEAGTRSYKTTFVTATGETAAGAASNVVDVEIDPPGACTAALVTDNTAAQIEAGDHSYKVTYVSASGETAAGTASNTVTNDGTHTSNSLTGIPLGPTGTTARKLYRTEAGGSDYKLLDTIADNTTAIYTDITPDASLTTAAPSVNTSNGKVSLTGIPVGPTGTTARKLYRTVAGDAGPYKLVTTIGNNIDTTYTDDTADGSLGGNAPSANTSGGRVDLTDIPLGPTGTTARKLYRRVAGNTGTWKLAATIANNTDTTYTDNLADGALSTDAPSANTTDGKVALTGIALGPAGTTARKIYRTVAGDAGDRKLVATIANNTDTTYVDNTPDGSLGASAPTSNTTGELVIPSIILDGTTAEGGRVEHLVPLEGTKLSGKLFVEVVSGSVKGTIYGR